MKSYFIFEALPKKHDEVASLLDANLTNQRFCRSNVDLWQDAIKTRALTRVPSYGSNYNIFVNNNYSQESEAVIRAKLLSTGSSIVTRSDWMPGDKLGRSQLDHAIDGATFMTFERSVACILSLNFLIVADIKKYEKDLARLLEELALLANQTESGVPDGAPAEEAKRAEDRRLAIQSQIDGVAENIKRLESALIGEHSIIVSCFYFFNIAPVVRAAISHGGYDSVRSLSSAIALQTDQSANLIENLFGNIELKAAANRIEIDRAVRYVASYPTMRSIFKTLLGIEACRKVIGATNREEYIQRVHVNIGNKTALPDERMVRPQKITRPPYDWGPPEQGAEQYPPGYEDDEPHAI